MVDVGAAGVNYADVLIREGRYPQPPPLPYVPGSEIAGETADGRRVIGFVRADGGGYAEKAVAEDEWLFDLPETATFEQGAAFLLAFLTAWIPLTRQARVSRREPRARHRGRRRRRERRCAGRARARRRGRRRGRLGRKSSSMCARSARAGRHVRERRRARAVRRRSSTRSAASSSQPGSSCSGRSARSSGSASPAERGPRSIPRCSSAGTSRRRASTSGAS